MAELSRPSQLTDQAEPATAETAIEEPRVRRLDIVGHRNVYFAISLLIIIPGIISMVTRGFLLGIDFAGGTEFQLQFFGHPGLAQVERAADRLQPNATVQVTPSGTYIIRTTPLAPLEQKAFEQDLARAVGIQVDTAKSQVSQVGPAIAQQIVQGALFAVLAAVILILFYLAFRFRNVQGGWRAGFQFGGSALLALLHDVFVLTGIFSILGGWARLNLGQIDSLFLTAVLTVVGFSVHDTIVVFDRIRENLVVAHRLSFEQVVNLSIMQTAARSIITSFTVILVLLALLFFGGETLQGFALALLIGIASGTYSSIFNAAPLLVVWRRLQPLR